MSNILVNALKKTLTQLLAVSLIAVGFTPFVAGVFIADYLSLEGWAALAVISGIGLVGMGFYANILDEVVDE